MSGPSEIERLLGFIVDPAWYRARYPDARGMEPARHFSECGLNERRDPNRWFDGAWYARQYADVAATGEHPLLHYMAKGAALKRDPHPRFDAAWYVDEHPEAAANPMLFHVQTGAARAWLTERPVAIAEFLTSAAAPFAAPDAVPVDIVVPVYRGLAFTQICLESVLADPGRPPGRVVAIDDCSPEPALRAWLRKLAKTGAIVLLRNKTNRGFVASVNRGIAHAGTRDVVLLNSDTEVPAFWLRRLQAAAYALPGIASVSPLSNNATICSYLGYEGAPIPAGMTLAGLDAACRAVNAGRLAPTPTTVGFCMYLRRAALDAVGLFDEQTFGKGYGEENDFCLRATAQGWSHQIACDIFVRHEGGASFGAAADERIARAYEILLHRYPRYAADVQHHVHENRTAPWRFAATMALFRSSGLPTILLISHAMDGGIRRHIQETIARGFGRTNFLLLQPATRGAVLSVPALPGHPDLILAAERWRDIAAVARSAGVSRAHIHHLMGLDLDVRALIHDLGVPFDVTVHDYFAICPQVTLLPTPSGPSCGEPGPAGCDACIANRPSHGATDILSWRLSWAWQFREAERVFAPSEDALNRLRRHGLAGRARIVAHEAVASGPWPIRMQPRPGRKLRVAVIGVLAAHKGAHLVASVAMAADPATLELHVIGAVEEPFPAAARTRLRIAGAYRDEDLADILTKLRPHAIWFPAPWPETYSYTLSAAIAAGSPIVAPAIGAFSERLDGRPLTWIVPPSLNPEDYLIVFRSVAAALNARRTQAEAPPRLPVSGPDSIPGVKPRRRRASGPIDLRRAGRTAIAVIPETFDANAFTPNASSPNAFSRGAFTPCAHIRLLRPLDHPDSGLGLDVTLADATTALRYRVDTIATQRHAVTSLAAAEALAAHAKRTGAMLLYDLDDDLLTVPPDHPEAADLVPKAAVVERMVRLADVVRVSTARLGERVRPLARRVLVVANALDERIWRPNASPHMQRDKVSQAEIPAGAPLFLRHGQARPVRILCMGTATHDGDFAQILPALMEIHLVFGAAVQIDLIGFVANLELPGWIRRLAPSAHAARSYPGFVQWAAAVNAWDIGLAPLTGTAFNACKSTIKILDYAALGLAVLASNTESYLGALSDGPNGGLVENTGGAWYEAISRAIRDPAHRQNLAQYAARHLRDTGTLEARAAIWRASWT